MAVAGIGPVGQRRRAAVDIPPEALGSAEFRADHRVRYAYVA